MASDLEFAGQHLSYLESMHDEYFGFARPVHDERTSRDAIFNGAWGVSAQYFGTGDIAATNDNAQSLGTFSSHYASYNLAYGQALTEKLSLGLSSKWINAAIDDVKANAFAVDLGSLYKVQEHLRVAATLTNIGSKLTFLDEGDSLPLAFHAAVAYQPRPQYLGTVEAVYPQTGLASVRFGGQWSPLEMVKLRLGYRTDTLKGLSPIAGVSVGMGLELWGQEFSYAWVPYGDLGNTQYFSLLMRFGAPSEAKRNLIQYQMIKQNRAVKNDGNANPEYQQLMQLLSTEGDHLAEAPSNADVR